MGVSNGKKRIKKKKLSFRKRKKDPLLVLNVDIACRMSDRKKKEKLTGILPILGVPIDLNGRINSVAQKTQ